MQRSRRWSTRSASGGLVSRSETTTLPNRSPDLVEHLEVAQPQAEDDDHQQRADHQPHAVARHLCQNREAPAGLFLVVLGLVLQHLGDTPALLPVREDVYKILRQEMAPRQRRRQLVAGLQRLDHHIGLRDERLVAGRPQTQAHCLGNRHARFGRQAQSDAEAMQRQRLQARPEGRQAQQPGINLGLSSQRTRQEEIDAKQQPDTAPDDDEKQDAPALAGQAEAERVKGRAEKSQNEEHPRQDERTEDELNERPGGLCPELAAQLLLKAEIFLQLAENLRHVAALFADRGQREKQRRKAGLVFRQGVLEVVAVFEVADDALRDAANRGRTALRLLAEDIHQAQSRPEIVTQRTAQLDKGGQRQRGSGHRRSG